MKETPDVTLFRHETRVTVRFHEVDMLGVCNNAVYINYFEQARLQYIKDLELVPEGGLFAENNFYMVRNEINYRGHSRFDDELIIYSRISYIGSSSYGFEHLVTNAKTGKLIADGKGVIVQVSKPDEKPVPLSDGFRAAVNKYEKQVTTKGG
ncbi:MAG: hypothetical protein AMXMBFR48_26870 [Ignavibacteriales bacterium]